MLLGNKEIDAKIFHMLSHMGLTLTTLRCR
jgi:hypothetical protein